MADRNRATDRRRKAANGADPTAATLWPGIIIIRVLPTGANIITADIDEHAVPLVLEDLAKECAARHLADCAPGATMKTHRHLSGQDAPVASAPPDPAE